MNAQTKPGLTGSDNLTLSKPRTLTARTSYPDGNPVVKHLDALHGQLQDQLDSLNTVVASMQRISAIMDRMAKKQCALNSGAALVAPARKNS